MENKLLPITDELLETLYPLEDDQLASLHLLITSFFNIQFEENLTNPLYKNYLKKLEAFIEETDLIIKPARTTLDATVINYLLVDFILKVHGRNANDEKFVTLSILLETVKKLIENYQNILKGKTFKDFFDDLSFTNGYPYSEKAEIILVNYSKDVLKETQELVNKNQDFRKEAESDAGKEELSKSKKLVNLYKAGLETVESQLKNISYERALLFNCICYVLCYNCLPYREFAKYQKVLLKAITAYKTNANPIQKQFTVKNANQAYVKLKKWLIEDFVQNINFGFLTSQEWDLFMLATDRAFLSCSNMDIEESLSVLDDVNLHTKGVGVTFEDKVLKYAETFFQGAKAKYAELKGISNPEEEIAYEIDFSEAVDSTKDPDQSRALKEVKDSESNQSTKDLNSTLSSSVKNIEELGQEIEKLDFEQDVFFHRVMKSIINMQGFTGSSFSQYKVSINKLISANRVNTNFENKNLLRQEADLAFKKAINTLKEEFEKTSDSLKKPEEAIQRLVKILMIAPIKIALKEVTLIKKEALGTMIKELASSEKPLENSSEIFEAYAYKFNSMGRNIFKEVMWSHMSQLYGQKG